MHTLEVFRSCAVDRIILVLPAEHIDYWKQLVAEYAFDVKHDIVIGGKTRFNSVRNGLNAIEGEGLVAIHDGVRPLVTASVVEDSFQTAANKGSAITSIPLKDSIRKLSLTGETRSENRSNYYLVQTPQTFKSDLIKDAYNKAEHENFTDDAGVLESTGTPVYLVMGDSRNIKITTKDDLVFATMLLDLNP